MNMSLHLCLYTHQSPAPKDASLLAKAFRNHSSRAVPVVESRILGSNICQIAFDRSQSLRQCSIVSCALLHLLHISEEAKCHLN
ncbi:uncharacterized protein DS421_14g452170 [Arachis hypogaea]|nr:uncharacterized protein DS421_14g452170 [Arachis hypogaea]